MRFKRHGLQGVRTDGLRMFTEVAECQKRVVAHIADDVFVVGVEGDQPAAIKARDCFGGWKSYGANLGKFDRQWSSCHGVGYYNSSL